MLERILEGIIKRIVSRVWNGRRTTRFQKRKRYDGRDVHSENGGTGEYGPGIYRPGHNAYDRVSREMAMVTLKWTGFPEAEARMKRHNVMCGQGLSRNSGWTSVCDRGVQSVTSQLLFIVVLSGGDHLGNEYERTFSARCYICTDTQTTWRIHRQRGGYADNVADTQTTWRIRWQRGGYADNVADTQTTWRYSSGQWDRLSRTVGGVERELWQPWTKSKMGVLWVGQQNKRSRLMTGMEETKPARQLCIPGWSGLRGRRHGDGNSQENTSWGECVE